MSVSPSMIIRAPGLALGLIAACAGGDPSEGSGTTSAPVTTGTGTTSASSSTTTSATTTPTTTGSTTTTTTTTSTSGTTTSSPLTTSPGETGTGTDGPVDGGPCPGYALVLDHPGPVLWVTTDTSVYEAPFLPEGHGFTCVRVEFDLQTLDNLAEIAADDPEGCPEFFGLASVFGTQISGDVVATAFYRGMDRLRGVCTPGASRLEVGNYLDYNAGTEGPWSPGQVWHIILEARPSLTRITIFNKGQQLGPIIAASLDPIDLAGTLDPVVRLGLVNPVEDRFYPWYGATYANLQVWAEVVPPPP